MEPLPEQDCRPKTSQGQQRPHVPSPSNTDCVYSTVELPKQIQTFSADKPMTKQQGHMDDDYLNYPSTHFKNKPKLNMNAHMFWWLVFLSVVKNNPCPITFEEPPEVLDSEKVTLTCSTLQTCPSNLRIDSSSGKLSQSSGQAKSISYSFPASWRDDGREFSCQTTDNKDTYLIKRVRLTVKTAPKDEKGDETLHVKEGEYVGRICSHPRADSSTKFHWLKNDQWYSEGAQLKLASVKESDSGYYNCKASIPGSSGSRKTFIDVSFKPRSTISLIGPDNYKVKINSQIKFVCNTTANPKPWFSWYLYKKSKPSDRMILGVNEHELLLKRVQREDEACYVCNATNIIGAGNHSQPVCIQMLSKLLSSFFS
ncbi:B-cell receptor CD22, partial [Oryzias melastigma]